MTTQHTIGDKVYFVHENEIHTGTINDFRVDCTGEYYSMAEDRYSKTEFDGDVLYPSVDALLKHLVDGFTDFSTAATSAPRDQGIGTVKIWEKVGEFGEPDDKAMVWVGLADNGRWYFSEHDEGGRPDPKSECDQAGTREEAVIKAMAFIAAMNALDSP